MPVAMPVELANVSAEDSDIGWPLVQGEHPIRPVCHSYPETCFHSFGVLQTTGISEGRDKYFTLRSDDSQRAPVHNYVGVLHLP